jgi:hypothetical protein
MVCDNKEKLLALFPCDLCICKAVCICKYHLKMNIICSILHIWICSFDIGDTLLVRDKTIGWRKIQTIFPSIISVSSV